MNLRAVVASSLILIGATSALAQNSVPKRSDSSPSGAGIRSHSPTSGTANYQADPNAASPSVNGNSTIAGQQEPKVDGNGQPLNDAAKPKSQSKKASPP